MRWKCWWAKGNGQWGYVFRLKIAALTGSAVRGVIMSGIPPSRIVVLHEVEREESELERMYVTWVRCKEPGASACELIRRCSRVQ